MRIIALFSSLLKNGGKRLHGQRQPVSGSEIWWRRMYIFGCPVLEQLTLYGLWLGDNLAEEAEAEASTIAGLEERG